MIIHTCSLWKTINHQNVKCDLSHFDFSPAIFNPYSAEIFLYKPLRPKGFFQFEIIINVSVGPFRCYGITAIRNILSVQGQSLYVRIWRPQTSDSDVLRRSPHWKG